MALAAFSSFRSGPFEVRFCAPEIKDTIVEFAKTLFNARKATEITTPSFLRNSVLQNQEESATLADVQKVSKSLSDLLNLVGREEKNMCAVTFMIAIQVFHELLPKPATLQEVVPPEMLQDVVPSPLFAAAASSSLTSPTRVSLLPLSDEKALILSVLRLEKMGTISDEVEHRRKGACELYKLLMQTPIKTVLEDTKFQWLRSAADVITADSQASA